MADTNRFFVSVTKLCVGNSDPTLLETKAHTITLTADGTLTVEGVKQRRVFSPDMWDRYAVAWIEPQPPFSRSTKDA
jgi:hypothetical protein